MISLLPPSAELPAGPALPRRLSPSDFSRDLARFCFDLLAPAPRIEVWRWAEENIVLDERTSPIPGRFSTELTPYIREPLECYADKSITDLTLCFGTQTGKTSVVMIGTSYRIVNDPMPVLWVMPNINLAESFSKTRWRQMVDDCQPLAAQKPSGKDRHLFTTSEQHFHKVSLRFTGSNSATNISSTPAGLLNMDEVDKFRLETEREAGALQLAEERTKNFPYPLRVKTSTPTTVHGEIWRQFLKGDQRYYHVPCPHCSRRLGRFDISPGTVHSPVSGSIASAHQRPSSSRQLVRWETLTDDEKAAVRDTYIVFKFRTDSPEHGECGLRWWRDSEDEAKTDGAWDFEKVRRCAFYKCQRCGGEIRDHHKTAMLREGIWVPTNPQAELRRRSYHLSSLYSLISRECTFPELAVKWLQARGSITEKHNFINSTLAETWDDEKAIDDNPIFRETYDTASLPADRVTIMSVDVQEDHFWVVVRAYGQPSPDRPNGESWQLFADRVSTIEEVAAIQREFGVEGKHVVLDMAKWPNKVARWIVDHGWRGLWGDDKKGFIHTFPNGQRVTYLWSPVKFRDPHLGSHLQHESNDKAMYMNWANDPIKDVLAALQHSLPPVFHVHAQAHKDYQRHMNAEQRVVLKNTRTGRYTYGWRQFHRHNHLRDCELMGLVRALQLGLVPMPDGTAVPQQQTLPLS